MEKFSYYAIYCVVILNLLVCVYCQQFVGDYCTISGVTGQCQIITNCPRAIEDLERGITPAICGFQGAHPIVCCVRESKSKTKCKEYTEYVYEFVVAGGPPTPDCAIVERPLVVGGEDAKSKEFPHMALIGFDGDNNVKEWQCGGSLISEQFVLTAGHCLYSPTFGEAKYVRLGELILNSNNDDTDAQDFNINQLIRHPSYRPPSRYNDIALLKLNRKARLSTYVRPACLETSPRLDFTREPIATGWGTISSTGPRSEILQKVTLEYFTHSKCNHSYRNDISMRGGIVDDSQICAGSNREAKDTCQGDSGGPLQIVNREEFCMYNIVGVTSFGKGCGAIGIPAVYTRVSSYIQWIEDIVWP